MSPVVIIPSKTGASMYSTRSPWLNDAAATVATYRAVCDLATARPASALNAMPGSTYEFGKSSFIVGNASATPNIPAATNPRGPERPR
jgi:hypothetical protein